MNHHFIYCTLTIALITSPSLVASRSKTWPPLLGRGVGGGEVGEDQDDSSDILWNIPPYFNPGDIPPEDYVEWWVQEKRPSLSLSMHPGEYRVNKKLK